MNEKTRCPTCGHIIDIRVISLYKGLICGLYVVYTWLKKRNQGYRFTRKELNKVLEGNFSAAARFGDLPLFGGLVFKEGKGKYGLNMERCEAFFKGRYEIPTKIVKDPVTKTLTPEDYRTIHNIPKLKSFLDEEGLYQPEYRKREPAPIVLSRDDLFISPVFRPGEI